MNCDVCKEEKATVFLTQIVNGKMQKVNLCEACSKTKGVDDPTGFALAEMLFGHGTSQEVAGPTASGHRCHTCGFGQSDFKKTGRFGCPSCYETFSEGLDAILKGMHRGVHHTGKIPRRILLTVHREEELKRLQRELKKAIGNEQFERAAELRDQIKTIETGA